MDLAGDNGSYKLRKEAFVSHNAGDSVLDINKVCWTAIVSARRILVTCQLYILKPATTDYVSTMASSLFQVNNGIQSKLEAYCNTRIYHFGGAAHSGFDRLFTDTCVFQHLSVRGTGSHSHFLAS